MLSRETPHQVLALSDLAMVIKPRSVILHREMQLISARFQSNANAAGAGIRKGVLDGIRDKFVDNQAQWHRLIHEQWSAINIALDGNWPTARHRSLEITAQLVKESFTVQRYFLIAGSEQPMHAGHNFDLLNSFIQDRLGLAIADGGRLHANET